MLSVLLRQNGRNEVNPLPNPTTTVTRWSPSDPIPAAGILLIRHGPREPGPFPRHDVPLTDEGMEQTRRLGLSWKGSVTGSEPDSEPAPSPACVLTSPVLRNRQTAALLVESAGWEVPVYDSNMLGNNGPFVVDPAAVKGLVKAAREEGEHDFLHRHIAGVKILGMLHRDVGVQRLLSDLRFFGGVEDLVVAISHDYIISSVLAHFGQDPDPWPEPLCGVVICQEPSKP